MLSILEIFLINMLNMKGGFDVMTAVLMGGKVFWAMTPCRLLCKNLHGVIYQKT